MADLSSVMERCANSQTFCADILASSGDVRAEFRLVVAKLAQLMRQSGASEGLEAMCFQSLKDWTPELKRHGLFKSVALPATAGDASPTGVAVKSEQHGVKREQLVQYIESVCSQSSAVASPTSSKRRKAGERSAMADLQRSAMADLPPRIAGSVGSTLVGCCCTGMCGSKACNARRNRKFRYSQESRCPEYVTPGRVYCEVCNCEVWLCMSPRFRGRWCKVHKPQYGDEGDARVYSNSFYPRAAFPQNWPLELRVTAKLGYALPQMLPRDFEILLDWAKARLSPQYVVALFLAHSIKWPLGVSTFIQSVGPWVDSDMVAGGDAKESKGVAGEPSTGGEGIGTRATAEAFVKAYRDAILAHDGVALKHSFERMNVGLMHAQTGAAVQGVELGILSAEVDKNVQNRLGFGQAATVVRLGPALKTYVLADPRSPAMAGASTLVEALLEESQKANLQWPASNEPQVLIAFFAGVHALVKKFRSIRHGKIGFRGGLSEAHEYKAKSFTRIVLTMLNLEHRGCFDGLVYHDLLPYCPDENTYTEVLSGLRVGEVERMFNINALLIPCWACLFGGLRTPERLRALLATPSADVLRVIMDDRELQKRLPDAERFPMGPRCLVKGLSIE